MPVNIRKSLINNYANKNSEDTKKLSLELFRSLEAIVDEFGDFDLYERTYEETTGRGILRKHDAKGRLTYFVYDGGSTTGTLNVEFFAEFEGGGYNKLNIHLYGNPKTFDAKVVRKLAEKFHSYTEGDKK